MSSSQITELNSYTQAAKVSLLADPTATPQFKHNQQLDDALSRSKGMEQQQHRKNRYHMSNEKVQSITDKKSIMFGFQKGKEIHMDQVRDKSKQRRGTTQIENRNNREVLPTALKISQ